MHYPFPGRWFFFAGSRVSKPELSLYAREGKLDENFSVRSLGQARWQENISETSCLSFWYWDPEAPLVFVDASGIFTIQKKKKSFAWGYLTDVIDYECISKTEKIIIKIIVYSKKGEFHSLVARP